MNRETSEF